jgi:hypothetical protein
MKIKGLPEGYDIVRIGRPEKGELFIGGTGQVEKSTGGEHAVCYLILRKIERPKQYRPFANAEEFKPHRDRWIRRMAHGGAFKICDYSNIGHCLEENDPCSWQEFFDLGYVFDDDGSPFGVDVSESNGPPITRPAQAEPSHK